MAGSGSLLLPLFPEPVKKLPATGFISGILKNNNPQADWKHLLERAAQLGYTEYEGGIMGDSPGEFRDFLSGTGLRHIASGLRMNRNTEELKQQLDDIANLGVSHAVTYWPWFVGAPFSKEDCLESVDSLNLMGDLARQRGLTFSWHSHDKEFHPTKDGTIPFHYLMQHTERELVHLELDIYWITRGGANASEIMKQYDGRTTMMHVKDMAADGSICCPGSGTINFKPIFREATRQGVRHFFVERDNAQDGLACLEDSIRYLRKLRF